MCACVREREREREREWGVARGVVVDVLECEFELLLYYAKSLRSYKSPYRLAQSAGAEEYTVHTSAERYPLPWVSCIWHKTNWWWVSSDARAMGNAEHLFIAIASRSTLARRGCTWYGPIYGLNRTKLHTYARTVWLNWIA